MKVTNCVHSCVKEIFCIWKKKRKQLLNWYNQTIGSQLWQWNTVKLISWNREKKEKKIKTVRTKSIIYSVEFILYRFSPLLFSFSSLICWKDSADRSQNFPTPFATHQWKIYIKQKQIFHIYLFLFILLKYAEHKKPCTWRMACKITLSNTRTQRKCEKKPWYEIKMKINKDHKHALGPSINFHYFRFIM